MRKGEVHTFLEAHLESRTFILYGEINRKIVRNEASVVSSDADSVRTVLY